MSEILPILLPLLSTSVRPTQPARSFWFMVMGCSSVGIGGGSENDDGVEGGGAGLDDLVVEAVPARAGVAARPDVAERPQPWDERRHAGPGVLTPDPKSVLARIGTC